MYKKCNINAAFAMQTTAPVPAIDAAQQQVNSTNQGSMGLTSVRYAVGLLNKATLL
jgi:hypothetical protein